MKTLVLVLTAFLIGFLIASVLVLNFMEYAHSEYESQLQSQGVCHSTGGVTYCMCFNPYNFISRLIGYKWGYKVKELYKFIVSPVRRNYE